MSITSPKLKRLLNASGEHALYVGATVTSAGVHFVYSIYVRNYIEPYEYGVYSTCLLLQTYMTYLQLGSLNAFNRDYPQYVGAKDEESAAASRNTILSFLLAMFSSGFAIVSISVSVIGGAYAIDARYIVGMICCALVASLAVFENFCCTRVRTDEGFKFVSVVVLVELGSVLVGLALVPVVGYYGLYVSPVCAPLIGLAMYYRRGLSDIKLKVERSLLKAMLISGMPLLLNNLIWTVVESIDKFVILGFLDAEALGLYSIAQTAFSLMVLVPTAMSQMFYVKLGKVYGATKSVAELNKSAVGYTAILAAVTGMILVPVYYLFGPLVDWLMPKYSAGVGAAQILMLGLAVYAPTMVNGNILTLLRKNAAIIRGSLYMCALDAALSIAFVFAFGPRIESVALGTSISYLIRTFIIIAQIKIHAGGNAWRLFRSSVVTVVASAGPGVVLYYVFGGTAPACMAGVAVSVLASALLCRRDAIALLRSEDRAE